MSTLDIRQKLHRYIETAQAKKVKAIFAMVEEEIQESNSHWDDKAFIADLQKREQDFRSGKEQAYTLDQAMKKARLALKKVKKR